MSCFFKDFIKFLLNSIFSILKILLKNKIMIDGLNFFKVELMYLIKKIIYYVDIINFKYV